MSDIYDDPAFFKAYSQMDRSKKGLAGAGEWHELKTVLPDFSGKRVLDLGCGYGWHCRYAAEHGAKSVLGIDTSAKMLAEAAAKTTDQRITYRRMDMQAIDQLPDQFDIILSSLAIHYIEDYAQLVKKSVISCQLAVILSCRLNIQFLQPKAKKSGSRMIKGTTFTGQLIAISMKASGRLIFWGTRLKNTIVL